MKKHIILLFIVFTLVQESVASMRSSGAIQCVAILRAAEQGDVVAVKMILLDGADVNTQSFGGQTALHIAAMRGHYAVAKILIEHGADRSIIDASGRTALQWALLVPGNPVIELLISVI